MGAGGGTELKHGVGGSHRDAGEYINDVGGSAELGTVGSHEEDDAGGGAKLEYVDSGSPRDVAGSQQWMRDRSRLR
ncbi:hypothetical protein E2562_028310 [Oryza meyeriana var. granulata]|uniref:Uncharacterized protein n=1 Tax=Oryza meyeriana var. granulata TaxID=110450 RepID=A0A6G1FD23_9ORYZ|nr:hypothetical protein E2562_028310 [Oryza meyeriana var. granulata]